MLESRRAAGASLARTRRPRHARDIFTIVCISARAPAERLWQRRSIRGPHGRERGSRSRRALGLSMEVASPEASCALAPGGPCWHLRGGHGPAVPRRRHRLRVAVFEVAPGQAEVSKQASCGSISRALGHCAAIRASQGACRAAQGRGCTAAPVSLEADPARNLCEATTIRPAGGQRMLRRAFPRQGPWSGWLAMTRSRVRRQSRSARASSGPSRQGCRRGPTCVIPRADQRASRAFEAL